MLDSISVFMCVLFFNILFFLYYNKIIPKVGIMEKMMDILVISRAKTKFINSVSVSLSVLPNSQGIHYYQFKSCEISVNSSVSSLTIILRGKGAAHG